MQVSNYATDVFTPIFAAIRAVSGAESYTDKVRACQALVVYWQQCDFRPDGAIYLKAWPSRVGCIMRLTRCLSPRHMGGCR